MVEVEHSTEALAPVHWLRWRDDRGGPQELICEALIIAFSVVERDEAGDRVLKRAASIRLGFTPRSTYRASCRRREQHPCMQRLARLKRQGNLPDQFAADHGAGAQQIRGSRGRVSGLKLRVSVVRFSKSRILAYRSAGLAGGLWPKSISMRVKR